VLFTPCPSNHQWGFEFSTGTHRSRLGQLCRSGGYDRGLSGEAKVTMYKPASLRQHLTHTNPDLKQNPDKLLVFVDQGRAMASGTNSLSFEYHYRLNIIITDYSGEPDAIMVPLLAWVANHQAELLNNPDLRQTGIQFEVDFNNHQSIDLSIVLDLTERTIVKRLDDGNVHFLHPQEPQMSPDFHHPFWKLYDDEQLLPEWASL
jgi:hypothetical protein